MRLQNVNFNGSVFFFRGRGKPQILLGFHAVGSRLRQSNQKADCEAANDESNAVAGKGKSVAVPPVPRYDRIPTAVSTD